MFMLARDARLRHITAMCASLSGQYVGAAETWLDAPEKTSVLVLDSSAARGSPLVTLESHPVFALAFAAEAGTLAGLGCAPTFQITVWDWRAETVRSQSIFTSAVL